MNKMTEEFVEVANTFPTDFYQRAASHYLKAVRKHPRFAGTLHGFYDREEAECKLHNKRTVLDYERTHGAVCATDLLECELLEAFCALNDEATVSELYDAVAVLMRMIAVVEGKQKLGGEE